MDHVRMPLRYSVLLPREGGRIAQLCVLNGFDWRPAFAGSLQPSDVRSSIFAWGLAKWLHQFQLLIEPHFPLVPSSPLRNAA